MTDPEAFARSLDAALRSGRDIVDRGVEGPKAVGLLMVVSGSLGVIAAFGGCCGVPLLALLASLF